jgi:uncharacterized protein
MTPQEQELVNELFDRLAKLESNPRDPDAEGLVADGLRRAPHAVYALVQTTLVQDEALKRANARIVELQEHVGGQEQPGGGSFLDNMRDAVLGRSEPRSSAPSAPSYRPQAGYPRRRRPILRVPVWHRACGPGLWFGRVVSGYGRLDGGRRDRRRAPAQQHPFDVR